jgi:aspartate-semialdehyde dehydrogenase
VTVESLEDCDFADVGRALFCTPAAVSRVHVPLALAAGTVVVDNSRAFRGDAGVPLVVPEANAEALAGDPRLVANPNCSTILLACVLAPLRRAFGLRAVDVATYQAISGAGRAAVAELRAQSAAVLAGEEPRPKVLPEPAAFNVFSHDSPIDPVTGLNAEEAKIVAETRRILGDPALAITPFCARVPVFRTHTEAVTATFEGPAGLQGVRRVLELAPSVRLEDDRERNRFPTSWRAAGGDLVHVGRIRPDPAEPAGLGGHRRWSFLLAGDQLRKGAALNAVQILELLTGPLAEGSA